MIYEILYPLAKHYGALHLFPFITFRTILAALTAFFVSMVLGPGIIRQLRAKKMRERVCSASAEIDGLRKSKAMTPTMGGVIILLAIVVSVLLFARLDNLYVVLGLWTVTSFALIGAADDWIKLTRPGSKGMRSLTKLGLQCLAAALVVTVLFISVHDDPKLTAFQMPFAKNWTFALGPAYLVVGLLVVVGASNGVNFTDGMDGLAIGGVTMTGLTFVVISYLVGRFDASQDLSVINVPGAGEMTVFLGAVVGAGLGFLWFNCFPAQVFMGDTGSLALGAALGYTAFVCRQEVALVVAGLMFVADGLSVVLQIGSYRFFGRRILPFAPISNWWLLRGQHEVKVTVRYWIVMALMGALSLALLKVR